MSISLTQFGNIMYTQYMIELLKLIIPVYIFMFLLHELFQGCTWSFPYATVRACLMPMATT